jgi:rod shape-determining protein MreC
VLGVILLSLNARPGKTPNALDASLLSVTAWLQNGFTGFSDGAGTFWSTYINQAELVESNFALRAELREVKAEKARLELMERELTQLKAQLEFRDRMGPAYLSARVIGRDTTPSFRILRLRIDRGETEIKKGMAVVTPEGIVGQITRVFGDYADVMLLADPQSRIDVMVDRTRSPGTLIGLGEGANYTCTIPYLPKEDAVSEGDLIVTSGLDQLFPKGLPVGTITKVIPRKEQPFQEVEVRPVVDFAQLEYVFVVTKLPPLKGAPQSAPASQKAKP